MSSENGGKFSHALVLGAGMEPVLLNHVDHVGGVATGLNAIGHAIIEARFAGLRSFVVQGVGPVWQWRTDTPEGCTLRSCAIAQSEAKHCLPSRR